MHGYAPAVITLSGRREAVAAPRIAPISEPLHLPLAVEAGEAGLAGEELLHGGLFEVALLGDEPVQPAQQRIHIAQRRRDGALFSEFEGAGNPSRQISTWRSIAIDLPGTPRLHSR